jgi:xylan 1,4-beta-xylosidase
VLFLVSAICLHHPAVVAGEGPETGAPEVTILVDTDTVEGQLYNFWNVYPVTIQTPFKDDEKHVQLRRTCRFAKYINCVRFLGGIRQKKDDYFRGVGADGKAICDFSEAIELLSGIRRCGFTPWIVLDNVPAVMSEKSTMNRYGNTEPPANYKVWSSYVRQLVRALVDEFGLDVVSRWRFRVGTEPDLKPGHWSATKEQYFAHYDHTVAAVLSVIPQADIGPGNIIDPAKKRKWHSWGIEIIDHCATGRNYATGEIGTPMKFFASSYYTDVGNSDERFDTLISMIRQQLSEYPQFVNIPVEIQEFGILSEGGKWIVGDGTEWGGSWMAHFANKIYKNRVPKVFQWEWNTTKSGGIQIPVTHVMGMLKKRTGETRLTVRSSQESELDDIGCIATKNDDSIDLIIFRHLATRNDDKPQKVQVALRGKLIAGKNWRVTRGNIINRQHSGFIRQQKSDIDTAFAKKADDQDIYTVAAGVMAINHEKYLSMSKLSQLEILPHLSENISGKIHFDLQLEGHSVVNLHLE